MSLLQANSHSGWLSPFSRLPQANRSSCKISEGCSSHQAAEAPDSISNVQPVEISSAPFRDELLNLKNHGESSPTMSRKAYFLVPGYDYAPDALIKPGQIISSLKTPYIPIGRPLDPPNLQSGYQDNWETERSRNLSGSIGIWAMFLATNLGVGGKIAGNIEREDSSVWRFRRLDTYFFIPDQAYIEASLRVPEVKKFFEENPKKSTFMITGVKVARGAELVRRRRRVIGADGSVGIDATAAGVSVCAGPHNSIARETAQSESFTGSSDFVFAYRLIKIYKHRKTGVVTSEEIVKGALYGLDSPVADPESSSEKLAGKEIITEREPWEFEIDGFDKEDIGLSSTPPAFEKTSVREGGEDAEICDVLWLKEETK